MPEDRNEKIHIFFDIIKSKYLHRNVSSGCSVIFQTVLRQYLMASGGFFFHGSGSVAILSPRIRHGYARLSREMKPVFYYICATIQPFFLNGTSKYGVHQSMWNCASNCEFKTEQPSSLQTSLGSVCVTIHTSSLQVHIAARHISNERNQSTTAVDPTELLNDTSCYAFRNIA